MNTAPGPSDQQAPPIATLSADKPIRSHEEDILGREPFASALARALAQWHGDESLVIALYGPWGSGKTSVKNMALDMLQRESHPPQLIEFNPWAWSGQDRIILAFFEEIGTALSRNGQEPSFLQARDHWNRYADHLTTGTKTLSVLHATAQATNVLLASTILEKLAADGEKLAELLREMGKKSDSKTDIETLASLKKSLCESLRKRKTPMLVVIDDIDRLTVEEIRQVFQLVKAHADFPKMIYLLLFDRDVVEQALCRVHGESGREYMEKIVQVGLDLPAIGKSKLYTVLSEELHRLSTVSSFGNTFDAGRWRNLYIGGIQRIFGTLRDVRRFLSTFSFTVGMFHRNGALEINVVDLIGIEALRQFEPDVYHALPKHRHLLIDQYLPWLSESDRKVRMNLGEALANLASEPNRDAVKAILTELFPGPDYGYPDDWARDLRVCHVDFFDRYFVMTVPDDDVPQSEIQSVLEVAGDYKALKEKFIDYATRGHLRRVLHRLTHHASTISIAHGEAFLTALFDAGDSSFSRPKISELREAESHAARIMHFLLKEEADASARSTILIGALRKTTGFAFPVAMVEREAHLRDINSTEVHLSDADLSEAKAICVRKFGEMAQSGKLVGPHLQSYLWHWRQWADIDAPAQFTRGLANTLEGSLELLRAFLFENTLMDPGKGRLVEVKRCNLETLEKFVDVSVLQKSLAPILKKDVAQQHEELARNYATEIAAFQTSLRTRDK